MGQDILHLHEKVRSEELSAAEVAWLEDLVKENPYFSLPHMILARHHVAIKSTVRDRYLQRSAAIVRDRHVLRDYLSDLLPRPKPSREALAPLKPKVEVAEAAVDTAGTLETTEPAVAEMVEATAPETVSEALADPVGEVVAKDTQEVKEVLQETAAEAVSAPAAEAEVSPEEPVVELPKARKPSPKDINWFLNMRINLLTNKYLGLPARLGEEVTAHAAALETTQVAPAAAETAAAESSKPVGKSEAAQSGADSAKVSRSKAKSASKSGAKSTSKPAAKSTAKAASTEPASRRKGPVRAQAAEATDEARTKVELAAETEEKNYEIGAFSSFTFLKDVDVAESDENEMDKVAVTEEAITIETSSVEEGGKSQLVLEEADRILEIEISPEQLEKYFGGRVPFSLNLSGSYVGDDSGENEKKTAEKSAQATEAESTEEVADPIERRMALIDRFIETEPSISRIDASRAPEGDLSKKEDPAEEEWVTETLARIHAMQGNKAQAIKIYKKLSLRFPEKRIYFADLIAKLKR